MPLAWKDISTVPEGQRVILSVAGEIITGMAFKIKGDATGLVYFWSWDGTDAPTHWAPFPADWKSAAPTPKPLKP